MKRVFAKKVSNLSNFFSKRSIIRDMAGPAFKIPQGLPSRLLEGAKAANDDIAMSAREVAKKRWAGQAAKEVVKSGIVASGAEIGMIAAAVPAFLGTMGLAAYAYLADQKHYDNKHCIPCGTEPRHPAQPNFTVVATSHFPKHSAADLDPMRRSALLAYVQSSSGFPAYALSL